MPTTESPTVSPTLTACTPDDPTRLRAGSKSRDCSWVKKRPEKRCKDDYLSAEGVSVIDGCHQTCTNCTIPEELFCTDPTYAESADYYAAIAILASGKAAKHCSTIIPALRGVASSRPPTAELCSCINAGVHHNKKDSDVFENGANLQCKLFSLAEASESFASLTRLCRESYFQGANFYDASCTPDPQ